MNTDDNTTTPTAEAPKDEPTPAAQATDERGPEASPPAAEASTPAAEAASTAPVSEASDDESEEEDEEQPGDDIGNRAPGAARPGGAPSAQAKGEAAGGDAKKRKRRRKRKGPATPGSPEAAAGEAGEAGAADEASEGEGEGEAEAEGGEGAAQAGGDQPARRKDKRKDKAAQAAAQRERPAFSVGEEVFGKVSRVTDTAIWIDIAGKATGLFDRRELGGEDVPAEGDQFIATVASTGVRGGMLVLCRGTPAPLDEVKTRVEAAAQSGDPVDGFVTGAVKGGLEVDIQGLRAFAPASHVDLRHGADLSYLVGQLLDFQVAQYAKKGRDVVVSRKRMLEEDARQARNQALGKIEPGSVHRGIVRKVVAWGVFVALPDAGNVEGLIHMTEASHDRSAKLTDIFRSGAEIDVKVVRVDEKGKLWLSHKATVADPWDRVKEKYAVGTRHKGKVARLQPFGAFIELEPGIDGLCHTADIAFKPVAHPSEVVKVGDEIDVVVASCDPGAHKIGLHPAPPAGEEDEPRQRVQVYKPVKVAVVQAVEGGLSVRVLGVTGRAARGFIPAGHTGTARGTDLRKEFPAGTKLEAKVLEIDPRRGEAKLSIRALKEDAEKQAYQSYRAGVAREAKFGTFADLMKKNQH
ncbi:S1 RNA-binding domain-containing protein [Polyangium aurulentum]|uniref:S1 RNA-binding domain-containing protein n=1 Tax=Polyangium aurulentum TaxID=2567896 RepID=UPI0010ADD243|nr:S1 RNA-binding domain-containing protein [Polyangium aurulentum]UQA62290.1 S1 RNA-binding domain-containing protein [Polyangium aurulentum]